MASGKGKSASKKPKVVSEAPKVLDPFKTKRSHESPQRGSDVIQAPPEVAAAIDAFRECQEQAKHFEGEATVHKDVLFDFGNSEFVKRLIHGQHGSFKIMGDESMVTFVVTDASAGLTDEDVQVLTDRWGALAVEELVTRDLRSIRFDPDVLAANYEQVVKALQVLPPEILSHLFKPMLMMAKPGAMEAAKRFAKSPAELKELTQSLKIKNYVR